MAEEFKKEDIAFEVPIYNDYIIVQNHKDNMPEDIKSKQFATAAYWRDKDGQLHLYLSKNIDAWRTIPHECLHLANDILAERNVIYYPTQDETIAYLLGFLTFMVSNIFFKDLYKQEG